MDDLTTETTVVETDVTTATVAVEDPEVVEALLPTEAQASGDPLFILVSLIAAVSLTAIAKKASVEVSTQLKAILPAFAVSMAVFARVLLGEVSGEEMSWAVLLQGLAAGAGAVAAHAQGRSLVKHLPVLLTALLTPKQQPPSDTPTTG